MRVYRALAGESLGTTVQRLRLARAAHLLATSAAPISEIAGRVGFETPQAFARAFRQQYGVAPSDARARDVADMSGKEMPAPVQPSAIRVDVVALEPFRVAVMRTEGAYAKLDEAYRGLFEWMAKRGGLDSITGIWGVPRHDRRDTPEESFEFLCCLASRSELTAGEGVSLDELGGGEYVRYLHEGSFDRLDESHDAVLRNLLERTEFKLRDSAILHEYLNDPEETPETDLRTHIYVPICRAES